MGRSGRVNGYVLHNENLLYEICTEELAPQPESCMLQYHVSGDEAHSVFATMLLNLKYKDPLENEMLPLKGLSFNKLNSKSKEHHLAL